MTSGRCPTAQPCWKHAHAPLAEMDSVYTVWFVGNLVANVAMARAIAPGRMGRVLAVVVPAVAYGVYHFASVDRLGSLGAMLDEVLITTLIGLLLGTYVELTDDLVVAWVAMNLINLFAFATDPQFHAGWGRGLIAVAFLIVILALLLVLRGPRDTRPGSARYGLG